MADRANLQTELEEVLGSPNVYFQPPPSIRMSYDAIRYKLGGKDLKHASNKVYRLTNQYDGVVITRDPDTTIPDRILARFEMCSFGSPYIADNLYHYPFTLYY